MQRRPSSPPPYARQAGEGCRVECSGFQDVAKHALRFRLVLVSCQGVVLWVRVQFPQRADDLSTPPNCIGCDAAMTVFLGEAVDTTRLQGRDTRGACRRYDIERRT